MGGFGVKHCLRDEWSIMERAIQEFIASLAERRSASDNTLGAYRTDLRQLTNYLQAQSIEAWDAVTPELLAGFVAHLKERQYATTSIARKVAAVKSFFAYLYTSGELPSDPARAIGTPKVEKYLPAVLTPLEMRRLFDAIHTETAAGQRDLAMLHSLYATGMRVSELVSRDVQHLDLARGHIRCRVRHRRERILPLSLEAQRALVTYLAEGRRDLLHSPAETALFVNHHGQRLTRQGFWLIMKSHARAAGIENITPHTLRHSFALDMLGKGMDLRAVQELLGHANISTTQVYAQLRKAQPEMLADVLERLDLLSENELIGVSKP